MNKQNYKRVVYLIGITIIITITVQLYWNYREYQNNKQNLIINVQHSLDNAVEDYYANLTRSGFITYSSENPKDSSKKMDTILVETKSKRGLRIKIDSTLENIAKKDTSRIFVLGGFRSRNPNFINRHTISKNIDSLISKIVVSFSRDTLDLEKLNNYLIEEFDRKKINVTYGLKFEYQHWVEHDSTIPKVINYKTELISKHHLSTKSKSNFLPYRSKLELFFTNETSTLLKDSLVSILLSLLLSICIIFSIIYLLKTIYKQKQLSEVKNDLISNITHEFKTPIATIATVLEAMKSFNVLEDKVKSEKYLSIANSQVLKLNEMVEKILETAILNQEELVLQKQPTNLVELLENIIDKFKTVNAEKSFQFINNNGNPTFNLDKFHFENALSNIIDNAIKYGGNKISIELTSEGNKSIIFIKDNGNGIHKTQKDKVFEQFYRISTGNTHNVKGFGIGLYYTKKIIEKHGGTIHIEYDKNNNTLFKIEFINE
tara:strand:- start:1488 stop:2954 length:1467 start_codon:yes stop_codon:yes gene_type:complete